MKPPVVANQLPVPSLGGSSNGDDEEGLVFETPTHDNTTQYVEGFSKPHPEFCGGAVGDRQDSTASDLSYQETLEPNGHRNKLCAISKYCHTLNVGVRPFRFYLQPNLSVYVSHVVNVKSTGFYAVEVLVDDKSSVRSGWYDMGSFKSTFEFDKFSVNRSYVRILLWQKRKLREDTVVGECVVALAEIEDTTNELPKSSPVEVKCLKLRGRPLMIKSKFSGPRLYADILVTTPKADVGQGLVERGCQTEEVIELRPHRSKKTVSVEATSPLPKTSILGVTETELTTPSKKKDWPPWPEEVHSSNG